jgi:hypothetical protein
MKLTHIGKINFVVIKYIVKEKIMDNKKDIKLRKRHLKDEN